MTLLPDLGSTSTLRFQKLLFVWMFADYLGGAVRNLEQLAGTLVDKGIFKGAIHTQQHGTISDSLTVLNRIDRKFASLGYGRAVRGQVFDVVALPKERQVVEAAKKLYGEAVLPLEVFALIHRNGNLVVSFCLWVDNPEGLTTEEALALSTLGLLVLEGDFRFSTPTAFSEWIRGTSGDWIVKGISLPRLASRVFTPLVAQALKMRAPETGLPILQETIVGILETSPVCSNLGQFLEDWGQDIVCLATMDPWAYPSRSRAQRVVQRMLTDDFSIDAEMGAYMGARSMALVCEQPAIQTWLSHIERKVGNVGDAAQFLDVCSHYSLFREWTLLEHCSIRNYINQFSLLVTQENPSASDLLQLKRRMIRELENFKERITEFEYGQEVMEVSRERKGTHDLLRRLESLRTATESSILEANTQRNQRWLLVLSIILLSNLALQAASDLTSYLGTPARSYRWGVLKVAFGVSAVTVPLALYYGGDLLRSLLRLMRRLTKSVAIKCTSLAAAVSIIGSSVRWRIRTLSRGVRARLGQLARRVAFLYSALIRGTKAAIHRK